MKEYVVKPIGFIRSELRNIEGAPLFYTEGAPNAWLELIPAFKDGLDRMKVGDDIIVIAWLHLGRRDTLKVHPQRNARKPLTGVFLARSPDRPNPVGLHRTRVFEMKGDRLRIGPIEAIDGTPILDIRPVVEEADDFSWHRRRFTMSWQLLEDQHPEL